MYDCIRRSHFDHGSDVFSTTATRRVRNIIAGNRSRSVKKLMAIYSSAPRIRERLPSLAIRLKTVTLMIRNTTATEAITGV